MKEENYNEKELQRLEEEIRAMGIPFSSPEPDERYFANFRVRLSERIEAAEARKGSLARIWSWVSKSPVRSLSLGAGLAAIVLAVVFIRPTTEIQVAVKNPVSAPPAIESIPEQKSESEIAAIPEKRLSPVHKNTKPHLVASVKPKHNKMEEAINKAGDFAAIDPRLSGGSDEPVNLESFSAEELQSVLEGIETMQNN